MYLLKTVNNLSEKSQIYVQLRDEHMRLFVFFHISKLRNVLKNENLQHLYDDIFQIIKTAEPGKLYHINNNQKK